MLVLAHLLADFILQGRSLSQKKKESVFFSFLHGFIFFVVSFCLLVVFVAPTLAPNYLPFLVLLGLSHFLIDLAKNYLEAKFPKQRLEWLVLDQIFHLTVIYVIVQHLFPVQLIKAPALFDRLLIVACGYILMWGGAYFVRRLLEKIPPIKEAEAEYRVGTLIGNLERILIFTLVLVDQYAIIGLVLAAKSIARFEELKQRDFAEYYLVGTLASTLIAVGTGILVKFLIF